MTIAESIVQEYLDHGYNLEALRLLALNRTDDLGKELLDVIEKLSVEKTPAAVEDSGPCETLASAVFETDENALVFVADDEEEVSQEYASQGSDAEHADATAEESIADVLIEEDAEIIAPELATARSDAFKAKVASLIAEEAEKGQSGILTRLWSRVAAKATPAMARHEALYAEGKKKVEMAKDEIKEETAANRESTIAEVESENVVFAAGKESSIAMAEASEIMAEPVDEPMPVAEQVEEAAELPAEMAPVLEQELTDDYLPGSVSGIYSEDATDASDVMLPLSREEAMRALLDAQNVITDRSYSTPDAASEESPAEGRSDGKKRNRKRKGKQADASAQDESLPEIILARGDGTETLCTEDEHEERAQQRDAESQSVVMHFPAPLEEENNHVKVGEPVAECMSEPMSLLTPNDLLDDHSDAAALFSLEREPEHADMETGEEAAITQDVEDEFAEMPGDHLMIISGGGLAADEYAHMLVQESLDADVAEMASEEEVDEEADNVILFSDKYPVFAGIRADEVDEYLNDVDDALLDEESGTALAGAYLRMLPSEPVDEVVDADEQPFAERVLRLIDSGSYDEIDVMESTVDESAGYPTLLHFLAPQNEEAVDAEQEVAQETAAEEPPPLPALEITEPAALVAPEPAPEPEPLFRAIDDNEKELVRRALFGFVVDADDAVAEEEAPGIHAIVREEPEPSPVDELEREAMVRAEMEAEYQERLDEFAARILQAQAATAAETEKVRQKQVELEARNAVIDEMQKRIDAEVMQADSIAGKLAEANSGLDEKDREIKARDKDLEFYSGMKEEHERLYHEFEDLRRGYNEIVSDVLPKLQGERDDLALTVERQCASEDKLRTSLGSVRRRMAVGYSLAGAACLAMCAFPVANWIKSGRVDREMATERQKLAELHDTLQREVQSNIAARNTIVELENKIGTARAQLSDMHKKNQELARLSRQRAPQNQDVAVFKPQPPASGGNPTRASEMALQATVPSGQRLHINQVRDPSGSIEELAMQNRQMNRASDESDQMVRSPEPLRPIALSTVATPESPTRPSNPLRPLPPPAAAAPASKPKTPAVRTGDVATVKVKKGEGVAQVVYRALGSWDPEVIAWVVKENKLTMDKRGNPRIHPDQELRIPTGNQVARSASASAAPSRRR